MTTGLALTLSGHARVAMRSAPHTNEHLGCEFGRKSRFSRSVNGATAAYLGRSRVARSAPPPGLDTGLYEIWPRSQRYNAGSQTQRRIREQTLGTDRSYER